MREFLGDATAFVDILPLRLETAGLRAHSSESPAASMSMAG